MKLYVNILNRLAQSRMWQTDGRTDRPNGF